MAVKRRSVVPPEDRAYQVVAAIAKRGGTATFGDIQMFSGLPVATLQKYATLASDRGWINRTGVPKSKDARFHLTDEGRAEHKRRQPGAIITTPAVDGMQTVNVKITHDDMVRAAGTSVEPVLVAGMINADRGASLRSRLIRAICEEREWPNVLSLMQHIRNGPADNFGTHEVTHILFELNRQGLIVFTEQPNGGNRTLARIRATKRLLAEQGIVPGTEAKNGTRQRQRDEIPQRATDGTDYRTHGGTAKGGPVEHVYPAVSPTGMADLIAAAAEAVEVFDEDELERFAATGSTTSQVQPEPDEPTSAPDPEAFPLLDALIARREAQSASRDKADKYLAAAALLSDVDPEQADRLVAQAEAITGQPFTALEVEYLRFAGR